MMPSLPIELPVNTILIEVADPIECSMLRFGLPCCNDAYYVFMCPERGSYHRLVAVCGMCFDEVSDHMLETTGETWAQWVEKTARGNSTPDVVVLRRIDRKDAARGNEPD